MATLNVSLPDQLRSWITEQVEEGRYSSASDYLRDLIREDIRHQEQDIQLLSNYLSPLVNTPDNLFVSISATEVKSRARNKMKEQS
jgi:antitoxin ParD1/3/4